ncbi:MAG TPA: putative metal-binding protein [Terriglobales bacterium]|nr:putative metal-binding protein [Terriglobales bacterium]
MRLDPAVNRLKYDRELARLIEQRLELERRGILLLGSTAHPFIDLLFVPSNPMGGVIPVTQQGLLFVPAGARVAIEVPSVSARAFKARFDLSTYDLDAPGLEFRDPWTDAPLQYNTMFRALQYDQHRKGQIVLLDDHPVTHKPFLCLRGIREYHAHPQHSGDEWLLYRESVNLFSIVMSLWRVAIDIPRPMLIVQENGAQVQWMGQEKP